MEISAQHKNARMSARKLRALREVVIGLSASEAADQLAFLPGKASLIMGRVLASAMANAKNNFEIETNTLKVVEVVIDGGYVLKRWKPRSRGMAHPYVKRTCHVTVVLEEAGRQAPKSRGRKAEIETVRVEDLSESQLRSDSKPQAGSAGAAHKERTKGERRAAVHKEYRRKSI